MGKNTINLSESEIRGFVAECVKSVLQEMAVPSDLRTKRASTKFMLKYRNGSVQCQVNVVYDDGEVSITLFEYDPSGANGDKWLPQAEWSFNAEEYTNGTWLPYWESIMGDGGKLLSRIWPYALKALKKVGYLADEDDEVPFRWNGDI